NQRRKPAAFRHCCINPVVMTADQLPVMDECLPISIQSRRAPFVHSDWSLGNSMLSTEQKLAFLSRPENYPKGVKNVEVRQTHMSWVFLADDWAWKFKKPVRTAYVDLRTPQARRHNCETEVQLNRRLAASVYFGTVPLNMDRNGAL